MASSADECSSASLPDCSICCEKYNKSTCARITCEYGDCKYEACKGCVRTYLLNTASDPHCMNCKKAWSQRFLVENLNKSYMTKDYKTHKKQFLLEREISKLPETMDAAERYKLVDEEEIKKKAFLAEIHKQKKILDELSTKYHECNHTIYRLKTNKAVDKTEKNVFIMPCPNNDCRGFLSSQYKCKLCQLHTCSKCHEIIGHSKEDEHTCKEENIQTAEMIKKETKPCPTCGTRISKISGCDQMWCPTCHKAFSWNTGKIDTGVIHNPHFYEYQRKTNGGIAPRNQGDIQCGGLCAWHDLNNILTKIKKPYYPKSSEPADLKYTDIFCKELRDSLSELHRCISHIQNIDLHRIRQKIDTLSNTEQTRINYIIKKISKEDMADSIYRNNHLRQKYMEYVHIYELFTVVGIELFEELRTVQVTSVEFINYIENKMKEFQTLREYCNEQFAIISNTYSQMVPQIDEHFQITSKKFGIKKNTSASNKKGKGKGKAKASDDMSDTMSMADTDTMSLVDTDTMSLADTDMDNIDPLVGIDNHLPNELYNKL